MGYGTKHGTDFNGFSKGFGTFWNKVFYCFGQQSGQPMGILPESKPAKEYQGHKMRFGISVRSGPLKTTGKETGFVAAIRQKIVGASTSYSWTTTTGDTECFDPSNRARLLRRFDVCFSSSNNDSDRNFRQLIARIAQYFTG